MYIVPKCPVHTATSAHARTPARMSNELQVLPESRLLDWKRRNAVATNVHLANEDRQSVNTRVMISLFRFRAGVLCSFAISKGNET